MIVSINLGNYMILYDVTNEITKQIKVIIQIIYNEQYKWIWCLYLNTWFWYSFQFNYIVQYSHCTTIQFLFQKFHFGFHF
jgi:hypothetical protein